ncbi:MAG TPA: DEAD/DEAH box helicase [Ignavibacteriaceae bacterium]
MNFKDLPIISPLQKALEKLEFIEATPIQEKVIPLAVEGKDVL